MYRQYSLRPDSTSTTNSTSRVRESKVSMDMVPSQSQDLHLLQPQNWHYIFPFSLVVLLLHLPNYFSFPRPTSLFSSTSNNLCCNPKVKYSLSCTLNDKFGGKKKRKKIITLFSVISTALCLLFLSLGSVFTNFHILLILMNILASSEGQ